MKKRVNDCSHFVCTCCVKEIAQTINASSSVAKKAYGKLSDVDLTKVMLSNLDFENAIYEAVDDIVNPNTSQGDINPVEDRPSNVLLLTPKKKKQPEVITRKQENLGSHTARSLLTEMKKTVISQDQCLRDIAIGVFQWQESLRDTEIEKYSMLIAGPTGTGKTETLRTLSKIINVPFFHFHAGQFSPTAYKGDNVFSIPEKIHSLTKQDSPTAIVLLDEIDKISFSQTFGDMGEMKRTVQQELLTIIDGGTTVTEKGGSGGQTIKFDTINILFVFAGSFPEMEKLKNAKKSKRSVGLSENPHVHQEEFSFKDMTHEDLKNFGFIPEFVGRISDITHTKHLKKEDLVKIISDSNNSPLKKYIKMFNRYHVTLEFSDSYLEHVAEMAIKEKVGARGLKKRVIADMKEHVFDIDTYSYGTLTILPNGEYDFKKHEEVEFKAVA